MQTNDSFVLCWGGLGWQLIDGVNISNASPKYLQPERVISGSCNYPPGYHPSDPTSGQSIVLGSPSVSLSFPAIVHSKLSIVYSSLPFSPAKTDLFSN